MEELIGVGYSFGFFLACEISKTRTIRFISLDPSAEVRYRSLFVAKALRFGIFYSFIQIQSTANKNTSSNNHQCQCDPFYIPRYSYMKPHSIWTINRLSFTDNCRFPCNNWRSFLQLLLD